MPEFERIDADDLTPERLAAMSPAEQFAYIGGWEPTTTVAGSLWHRKTPTGDAGDVVVLQGFAVAVTAPETHVPAIVVASAEFGAVPEGWTGPTELLTFEEFTAAYELLPQDDRQALAEEQIAASEKETARVEKLTPAKRNAEAQERLKAVWS